MSDAAPSDAALPQPGAPVWFRRLSSVLLIIFCSQLGLFLLVYPWTIYWSDNYFSSLLHEWWDNSYLRGACSGMGLLNIWVSLTEIFRLVSGRKTA